MTYVERALPAVPGAVLWRAEPGPGGGAVVLPDGCMDLLWAGDRLWVAGPDTRPHPPGEVGGGPVHGVRLPPGLLPALLGAPADRLRDLRVDLADVWSPHRAARLADRVPAAPAPGAALAALTAALAEEAGPRDPWPPLVARRLVAGERVAALAADLDLAERTLHRRCLAAFGYGPRVLARILRLRRALALVAAGVPCARAAARCGYADQSHLAREVRALAGRTLTEHRQSVGSAAGSGANREISVPSGSATVA
ncbi:helix-turn-helix domain-containing protein [Streptomyces sp. BI20]|uniref:helix-turn-helix domain-containing protein n=1 Tax=Streptomyces sp. BI20 TaxID=3403460 RepID=UPI003C79608B